MASDRETLPPGTPVGAYRVIKQIAKGGFSLIYLATDEDSGEEVVIKEYMPNKIARRDHLLRVIPIKFDYTENFYYGKKLFFQEVKALALLRHPNIVRVLSFILAYDTGYLVMPNERGRNLATYLQERKGSLSTTSILEIFIPILDALALLHHHAMVHLDVKPGNIHLRHGQQPLLLDLGAVQPLNRERSRGGQVITAGFSPVEQYFQAGQLGPWTDVYAVGASIRNCMDGRTPIPAPERQKLDLLVPAQQALKGRYPPFLLAAADWAMQMDPAQRPQDAAALLAMLAKHVDDSPRSRFSELPSSQQFN